MKHWICPRCTNQGDAAPPGPDHCPSCDLARPASGWSWMLEAGEELDRHYRIEGVLSVASAGPTYLARELGPRGEPVDPRLAIKTLFPSQAEGPFLRQLQHEANVLQQLAHPHVVQSRGFVHRSGHPPYLVTRYEVGGTLADHVARLGPLPDNVALGIATQIARALALAHRHGVVHLDLAPSNVLLEATVSSDAVPHCRLTGFGLAGGASVGVGTPEFAAPEQFEPYPVSRAADVFAIGALLWWMLEGEPLVKFTDTTQPTRCLDDWITALARRPRGRRSPEVERWLDQTLQADPERRPLAALLVDEGDATLVGHADNEDSRLTSRSLGFQMGTRLDSGRLAATAADEEHSRFDESEDALTEVNAPWPSVIGAAGPETPAGIGSGPRAAGGTSWASDSGRTPIPVGSSATPPSVLSSYTGSFQTPVVSSGPQTFPSGIRAVSYPRRSATHSAIRPAPSPARSVLAAAAVVVVAFLVAAAGVVAGYLAMSTWGGP